MYPKPLEIICYHCQQAAEKYLKALLVVQNQEITKTHDLGLLASKLTEFIDIPENVLDACDLLTPYGVKVRYPQEVHIEEYHVKKALFEIDIIKKWITSII